MSSKHENLASDVPLSGAPTGWKRAFIEFGLRVPGLRYKLSSCLDLGTGYGLEKAAERIVHPDTGYDYQNLRNTLCDRARGSFRGRYAIAGLGVLAKGYEKHSARKEQELREADKKTKAEGNHIGIVEIRYAIADVLKSTDHLDIMKIIASDLPYEWNSAVVDRAFDAFGEHAKEELIDDIIPVLKGRSFDIRSKVARSLSGTRNVEAQCAMVDALQDACRMRFEECSAGAWDAGTEMISGICEGLLGTEIGSKAKDLLRDQFLNPRVVHFSQAILAKAPAVSPDREAKILANRDPDHRIKEVRMMAEMMAKDQIVEEARRVGVTTIDWHGPTLQKYEKLTREIERSMLQE